MVENRERRHRQTSRGTLLPQSAGFPESVRASVGRRLGQRQLHGHQAGHAQGHDSRLRRSDRAGCGTGGRAHRTLARTAVAVDRKNPRIPERRILRAVPGQGPDRARRPNSSRVEPRGRNPVAVRGAQRRAVGRLITRVGPDAEAGSSPRSGARRLRRFTTATVTAYSRKMPSGNSFRQINLNMITRIWHGYTKPENADAYHQLLTRSEE